MARIAHPTVRWLPPAPLVGLAMFATALAIVVAVLGAPPVVHQEFERARTAVSGGDAMSVRDYLQSFGPLAPIVSVGMMVLQAVIAPVPGFIVVFANGLAFGVAWGVLVSLAGYAAAAALCFWLARRWGRRYFVRLADRLGLAWLDERLTRSGAWAVFVLRLLPGFSFDGVSYIAGLTRLQFGTFLLASVAGSLPQVVLFVYLGERAQEQLLPMLAAGLAITMVTTAAHWVWTWRRASVGVGL